MAKAKLMQLVEVDVKQVRISLPVNYDDEDIPFDFPHRVDDVWAVTIDIDTG